MPQGKVAGYDVMVGADVAGAATDATIAAQKLYVPLVFWFNRNPGLAFPLSHFNTTKSNLTLHFLHSET